MSVIDFALVSKYLYDKYIDMRIDDNKEILDISDWSMLQVRF